MLYYLHETQRMAMAPARMAAEAVMTALDNPWWPGAYAPFARELRSAAQLFEQVTRRYGKPAWGLDETVIEGQTVAVEFTPHIKRTYCHLMQFKRDVKRDDPKLLVVAPFSGHFATLLRGTVEAMLPDHDVYVTDWQDCRMIPMAADRFNLDDYIDYIIDFLHYLGPNTHVLAVCQPAVPCLAATAVMGAWGDLCTPATLTLMGGPIDTRIGKTAVNELAQQHEIHWFESHVLSMVPPPYPGVGRRVYPGFLQLTNFMSMNLDRHMASLGQLFDHLVQGDEEAADKKLAFYEEYLAVMDLPAEFFLQTVEVVFQKHDLPRGEMMHRWQPVNCDTIAKTAILCIEGELDDISGVGQTRAALDITPNLDERMKDYLLVKGAGHYGIFNGGKWRRDIAPHVKRFIRKWGDADARKSKSWRGADRRKQAAE